MDFNKKVGENINYYRKLANKTLKEVAHDVGITEATMQKYEAGKINRVDISMVSKIAKSLGTQPEDICGWSREVVDNISSINNYESNLMTIYDQFGYDEHFIIEVYNKLPSRGRKEFIDYVKTFQEKYKVESTSEEDLEEATKENMHI